MTLFSLALLLRAGCVVAQHEWGVFYGGVIGTGDQRLYGLLAHSLMTGQGLAVSGPINWTSPQGYPFASGPTAWVTPGYPLFVAACVSVLHAGVVGVEAVQAVLGAIAAVLIGRTAAEVFGSRAGTIAGFAAAVFPELVVNTFGLFTEPLYTFLVAAALWLLVRADRTRTLGAFGAAGTAFGVAAMVRPPALYAAGLIFACLALRPSRAGRHQSVSRSLAFIVTCLAVTMPWGVRNLVVMGHFTLVSSEGGYVFWLGNNPGYDRIALDPQALGGYGPGGPGWRIPGNIRKPEMEIDRVYRDAAIDHVIRHPLLFLGRIPHKMWNMWRPSVVGSSWRHELADYATYVLLMLSALAGLVLFWRRDGAWLLVLFLAAGVGLHALSIGSVRYRVSLWPALIPFSAMVLDSVWRRVSSSKTTERSRAPSVD